MQLVNGLQAGTVVWFDDGKGFGFIRPAHDCHCSCHSSLMGHEPPCAHCRHLHPEDIYVHYSHIDTDSTKRKTLIFGQRVMFELAPATSKTGKKDQAVNVRVVS